MAACCTQQGVSGAAPARLAGCGLRTDASRTPGTEVPSCLQCSAAQQCPAGAALLQLCKQAGERSAWHSCHDV